MSYILDALKKSDQERKQGDVPNLQTVYIPVTTAKQSSWGLYGVILLLLLGLVFVIGFMLADRFSSQQSLVAPADVQQKEALENESIDTALIASQADKKRAEETDKARQSSESQQATNRQSTTQAIDVNDIAVDAKKRVTENASRKASVATDLTSIPYLHELADYLQQSIPQMNFAGHVYSSTASSRSVIINGVVMSEGDIIVEGLKVEQITPKGVVFEFQGELFRMDILQDWSFD